MPTSPPKLYHLTWEELHRDTRALAARLLDTPWRGVIGIARGGLIPATILARELDIRLIDSLCIASYDHDRQGDPQILKGVAGEGDGFLLVDDLVDTGVTARLARKLLPQAKLVAVYAKPRGMSTADLWAREFEQDVWIHFPWDIGYQYAPPLSQQR